MQVIDYYPYGAERINEQIEDYRAKYTFTGKEKDNETNLHYYGARYYNAEIGRFTQIDPLLLALGDDNQVEQISNKKLQKILENPQYLNAYSYVGNNPIRRIDSEGEFWKEGWDRFKSWGTGIGKAWAQEVGDFANNPKEYVSEVSEGSEIIREETQKEFRENNCLSEYMSYEEYELGANSVGFGGGTKAVGKAPQLTQNLSKVPGHIKRLEKNYVSFKVIGDKVRYYTKLRPAKSLERLGAKIVTEVDKKTGKWIRVWQEVYDNFGRVIEVHPKKPIDLGHIKIDPITGREVMRR